MLISWVIYMSMAWLFSGASIESLVGAPMQQGTPFELGLGQLALLLVVVFPVAVVGLLILGTLTLDSGCYRAGAGRCYSLTTPSCGFLTGAIGEGSPPH